MPPALPKTGLRGRDDKPYHAHPDLIMAANVALALRRPLLLTGEPGCGKTDFAWAAERALRPHGDPERPGLLESHVRSDSRASDLLYRYDALSRFSDAHHGDHEQKARAREPRSYIELLPLGEALVSPFLRVVLIDEIDKAPRDLPNDLLRELDHGRFTIPEIPVRAPPHPSGLARELGRPAGARERPFVIVTSNVERQLPDPFLRRCVFYNIRFPDHDTLRDILRDRFPGRERRLNWSILAFERLRQVQSLTKKPATSELIDWVDALGSVLPPQEVDATLAAFAEKAGRADEPEALPWRDLPALCCLVKLREDLKRLGAA